MNESLCNSSQIENFCKWKRVVKNEGEKIPLNEGNNDVIDEICLGETHSNRGKWEATQREEKKDSVNPSKQSHLSKNLVHTKSAEIFVEHKENSACESFNPNKKILTRTLLKRDLRFPSNYTRIKKKIVKKSFFYDCSTNEFFFWFCGL